MKLLLLVFFFSTSLHASSSAVIPVFLEAAESYIQNHILQNRSQVARPDVQAIMNIFVKYQIAPELIERVLENAQKKTWNLPQDDQFDEWTRKSSEKGRVPVEVPNLALHAVRIDVNKKSEILGKDDVYAYFFITDGVIPTGRVTSIYKGIDSGESFFFNQIDRAIFPLLGVTAKKPDNHLIVDYGIIESDGDDIKNMQKLSSIIIDIAIAVYASQNPQQSQVIVNLRKEIKALSDLLLSLNQDDRIVTSSFGYTVEELANILSRESYFEIKRSHEGKENNRSFNYDVHFRLLRN